MHLRTHPKPESIGQAGRWQGPYHDAMTPTLIANRDYQVGVERQAFLPLRR